MWNERDKASRASTPRKSLLDGVDQVWVELLSITNLKHISALQDLSSSDGPLPIEAIYSKIEDNYQLGGATANKDRSLQNWRWPRLQTEIAARNTSREVCIERAIVNACDRLGRADWANRVPVASGLIAGARESRRAIDLVRRRGERHFELIELKFASDTPLYAAAEIIGYACLWLIARGDRPARESALLDANRLDLRVLAPIDYYARYTLTRLEDALDAGVRALGERHEVVLTFAFEILDERIRLDAMPDDQALLDLLEHPAPVTMARPK